MEEGTVKYYSDDGTCVPASEIQSMFHDWRKNPQTRLAYLIEALNLSSSLEEVDEYDDIEDEENDADVTLTNEEEALDLSTQKTPLDPAINISDKQICQCLPNQNNESICCSHVRFYNDTVLFIKFISLILIIMLTFLSLTFVS